MALIGASESAPEVAAYGTVGRRSSVNGSLQPLQKKRIEALIVQKQNLSYVQEETAMIFHASIPADDPERVARVLGEVLGGDSVPFHSIAGSFMARGSDEYHTSIEVYPRQRVSMPGEGDDEQARSVILERPPQYGCFHLAVGTPLSVEQVLEIGRREGWRTKYFSRHGAFDVIEFWVENSLMIELLTESMQRKYLERVTMSSKFKAVGVAPAAK